MLLLSLLDGHDDFMVYSDATDIELGCALMQKGRVITYVSRQLKVHELLDSQLRACSGHVCLVYMKALPVRSALQAHY